MSVPTFYTVVFEDNGHNSPIGTVFAESSNHDSEGWICLGYVSKQTPFGQGIFCGFKLSEVRQANMYEVLAALDKNHPHGAQFRPHCQDALDASFHLVMSSAIGNWTNDSPLASKDSIMPFSKAEIELARTKALSAHRITMANWDEITSRQIKEIHKSYPFDYFITWIKNYFASL